MEVRAPEPPLSDGVVSLRPWRLADVPAIAAACREAEIARWLNQVPQPYSEADARSYVEAGQQGWRDGSDWAFAITDAATGDVLGSIGVRPLATPDEGIAEVGYWVRRESRGRRVATRALRLVAAWTLRELRLRRLQLRADVENVASQRVAENAGFVREGVLRASRYNARRQQNIDFVIYSLLPNELS
jgi:RimJ/RimL family protein N-acetyltransferase